MARPTLNLQNLRDQFPSQIFERGQRYQKSGEVLDLTLRGNLVLAGVQGSEYQPYRVRLELSEDNLKSAECSCPYGDNFGGYCKHIAAVALEYHHRPETVISEASVAELLEPLGEKTLRSALEHLLELYPEMIEKLELHLQKKQLREKSANASQARGSVAAEFHATLDTHLFEKMMQSAVRNVGQDWDGFPEYDDAYKVIEEIKPFLDQGAYRDALTLTRALVHTFVDEVNGSEFNEYGNIGFSDEGIFLDFDHYFAEAVLGSVLSAAESKRLLYEVLAWNDQIGNEWTSPDLAMTAHALAEGLQAGDAEADELLHEVTRLELYGDSYAQIRLRVLRATGQSDAALAFAEQTRQGADYLLILLDGGKLEQVMQTYRKHIRNEQDALSVAEQLAADHPEKALEMAQYGLARGVKADMMAETTYRSMDARLSLATFGKGLALRLGQLEDALDAGLIEFRLEASVERYEALRDLVEKVSGDWQTVQTDLLSNLRHADYSNRHAAVDILLMEDLAQDAVKLATTFSNDGNFLRKVMGAVMNSHAQWVIDTAVEMAEPIMTRGRAKHYGVAANWLGYAKEAYLTSGREAQWQAYIAGVREEHGRKYKLMGELEAL